MSLATGLFKIIYRSIPGKIEKKLQEQLDSEEKITKRILEDYLLVFYSSESSSELIDFFKEKILKESNTEKWRRALLQLKCNVLFFLILKIKRIQLKIFSILWKNYLI